MKVKVDECIEEIVKLTLMSSIHGGLDLGLSPQFCSTLLKQDDDPDDDDEMYFTDFTEGVPAYPLYKNLASALCKSISSGAFCGPREKTTLIHTKEFLKQKEEEWSKLIREKGSDLVQVLKMLNFDLHVQEPFFSQLKDGLKTVEGRCAVGDYNRISPGALILFNKCLVLQVQDVHKYASFSEMLEAESIDKVLPGIKAIEEGVQIYRNFYPEEKERLNVKVVKSSTLTIGARSLAKHVDRSNLRFWGNFCGNDSAKNMLAFSVIRKLIANCCWLNLHTVPPHGVVFEIWVSDGYGARWSEDGTKFTWRMGSQMVGSAKSANLKHLPGRLPQREHQRIKPVLRL